MGNKFRGPRGAAIVFLCLALVAIWLLAVYGTYEDSKREKYEVRITPGAVNYGTHSTALMPMAVSTVRMSAPMVSAGEVRSYAHYGHASAPVSSSSKGLYTTSSASVKTIGSGGMAGGSGIALTTTRSSSSRGISYTTASVSVPTFAVNNSMMTSQANTAQSFADNTATRYGIGPRKAPGTPGTDGEWREDGGKWWYYDEGEWVEQWEGATRSAGGGYYWKYTGGSWIYVDDHGNPVPETPVGEIPWMIMILLACAYALTTLYRKYKKTA